MTPRRRRSARNPRRRKGRRMALVRKSRSCRLGATSGAEPFEERCDASSGRHNVPGTDRVDRFVCVNPTGSRCCSLDVLYSSRLMPVHLPDTVDAAVAQLAEDPTATVLAGHRSDGRGERRAPTARPLRGGGQPDRGASVMATQRRGPDRHDRRHGQLPGVGDRSAGGSGPRARPGRGPSVRRRSATPERSAATSGRARRRAKRLPVLAALDGKVELAGPGGRRSMPVTEFMVGVKRNTLAPGEMIVSVTLPLVEGWQGYAKVGVRNAMVIAVASACVVLDRGSPAGVGVASSVRSARRSCDARGPSSTSPNAIDWGTFEVVGVCDSAPVFGGLVAAGSRPITDHPIERLSTGGTRWACWPSVSFGGRHRTRCAT